jgi:hypothetical protein
MLCVDIPTEKLGIQRLTFRCPLRGMWIPQSGHPIDIPPNVSTMGIPFQSRDLFWALLFGHKPTLNRAAPPGRPSLVVAGHLLHMPR